MVTWEKGATMFNSGENYMVRQRGHDDLLKFVDNDGTYTRQADSVLNYSTRVTPFHERDHIRIQEVSVNYQVPSSLTQKLGLGRTTLALSGQNLMWWDDCWCMEPTQLSYGGSSEFNTLSFLETPSPRTFMFSLRTTF
jgi:hypothetical protein